MRGIDPQAQRMISINRPEDINRPAAGPTKEFPGEQVKSDFRSSPIVTFCRALGYTGDR